MGDRRGGCAAGLDNGQECPFYGGAVGRAVVGDMNPNQLYRTRIN